MRRASVLSLRSLLRCAALRQGSRCFSVVAASDYVQSSTLFQGVEDPFGALAHSEEELQVECPHCQRSVAHVSELWICYSCGHTRCASDTTALLKGEGSACPECGAALRTLSLPSVFKTRRGMQLLGVDQLDAGHLIVASVHAVGLEAQQVFAKANVALRKGDKEEAQREYTFCIKALHWISSNAPEHFHACGHDADMLRCLALRAIARGEREESRKLLAKHPDLFVGQDLVPYEAPKHAQRRNAKAKAHPSSLLLSQAEFDALEQTEWQQAGNIMWARSSDDVLFGRHSGVATAGIKWQRELVLVTDSRWIFNTSWDAANYLASRYKALSDGLKHDRFGISVGTDCVTYAGAGWLKDGTGHVVHNNVYREENVVMRTTYSERVAGKPNKATLMQRLRNSRLPAWKLSAMAHEKVERHPCTQPLEDAPRSWWQRLIPRST